MTSFEFVGFLEPQGFMNCLFQLDMLGLCYFHFGNP